MRDDVLKVATPVVPAIVPVPICVPPSRKVTVPVGAVVELEVTDAENVTEFA